MINRKHRAALVALVLLIAIYSAGCPKGALVLIKDAANANLQFERAVRQAHTDLDANGQPFVDDDTERTLLTVSKKFAQLDDKAVDLYMAGDKAGVLVQLDALVALVDDTVTNGLAGIKNPAKQTVIHSILLGLRGTFMTAKALLS
jgi:hypothetical protein